MHNLLKGVAATLNVGVLVNGSGVALGSLNIIRGEMLISKNGGALATISGCATAYPDKNGNYFVGLDTNDTDTGGNLKLVINNASCLPHWEYIFVDSTNFGYGRRGSLMLVGSVPNAALVGSVGHVASMSNPIVGGGIIGSVGHVASINLSSLAYVGSVGYAGAIGSVDLTGVSLDFVGSVGYAAVVGSIPPISIGTVSFVQAVGSVAAGAVGTVLHAITVGSVGHVASMSSPFVPYVGSIGFAGIVGTLTYGRVVGSVGHVASLVSPVINYVPSVGFAGGVGSVGHVASLSNPQVPYVGSVGFTGVAGTVSYVGSLNPLPVADALLKRDIDQVEATAPVHSLTVAILKAVSKVKDNAGTLEVYQTDGATLKMSQALTTDASNEPIDELGVGS